MGACQSPQHQLLDDQKYKDAKLHVERQLYSTYDEIKIDECGHVYHLYDENQNTHIFGNISEVKLDHKTINQHITDKYGNVEIVIMRHVSMYHRLTQLAFQYLFELIKIWDNLYRFTISSEDLITDFSNLKDIFESIPIIDESIDVYALYIERFRPIARYPNSNPDNDTLFGLLFNPRYQQDNTGEYHLILIQRNELNGSNIYDHLKEEYNYLIQPILLLNLLSPLESYKLYGGTWWKRYRLRSLRNDVEKQIITIITTPDNVSYKQVMKLRKKLIQLTLLKPL